MYLVRINAICRPNDKEDIKNIIFIEILPNQKGGKTIYQQKFEEEERLKRSYKDYSKILSIYGAFKVCKAFKSKMA